MNRKLAAAIFAALTLTSALPEVEALNAPPDARAPPTMGNLPRILPTSGIIPVNRTLNDANVTVVDAYNQVSTNYSMVASQLNQASDEATGTFSQPLVVFRDGAGGPSPEDPTDRRAGGYGPWKELGTNAWGVNAASAAPSMYQPLAAGGTIVNTLGGSSLGYTTGTLPNGLYPGGQSVLLVSPEIDLRTDSVNVRAANTAVGAPFSTLSASYDALWRSCSLSALAGAVAPGVPGALAPFCQAYVNVLALESPLATLQMARRFNLANGRDGVQVLAFRAEPATEQAINQCRFDTIRSTTAQPCEILQPVNGYSPNGVPTLPQFTGYTGFSSWAIDQFDLNLFIGGSVWIGIYFTSTNIINPTYFADPGRFNTAVPFRGFDFDDMVVNTPAPPINIGVRPLTTPRLLQPTDPVPIVPLGTNAPVDADISNLGTTRANVLTITRVWDQTGQTLLRQTPTQTTTLNPGEVLHVASEFAGLGPGMYMAEVCASRLNGVQGDYCTNRPNAVTPCVVTDPGEANFCDDQMTRLFNVRPVQPIIVGQLGSSAKAIQVGDTLAMTLPLTSIVNRPETVQVQAHVVDVATGTLQDALLTPSSQGTKTIDMGPLETKEIQWEIQGAKRGQYKLFARVGVATPFDGRYDLLPPLIQPWRVDPVLDPLSAIDGNPQDLSLAQAHPLVNGAAEARLQNDDNTLTILLRNVPVPQNAVTILFDDFDQTLPGKIAAVQLDGTGLQAFSWNGAAYVPMATTTAIGAIGAIGGNNFEIQIPISHSQPDALAVSPGGRLGIFVMFCTLANANAGCVMFPQFAGWQDGETFFPRDGQMSGELGTWQVAELVRPSLYPPGLESLPVNDRRLSPGFGVAMGPPPYYTLKLDQCPSFAGWGQFGTNRQLFGGMRDRWNCGTYPDDGQVRLYKAVGPDDGCPSPCLPYSGIPNAPAPQPFAGYTGPRNPAFPPSIVSLWSQPVDIPTDAENPTALLAHQFSTEVQFLDHRTGNTGGGILRFKHILSATLERWTGTAWAPQGFLVPSPDYVQEIDAGVDDPARPPRSKFFFTDCPPVIGAANINWGLGACAAGANPFSWWWPQGNQTLYRSQGSNSTVGQEFMGGSPWQTAEIPLTRVFANGLQDVDVKGATIRIRFDYEEADRTTPATKELDWGWRIGGLAVMEGAQFMRDLSIVNVTIPVAFDPQKIGIGPDTLLPIRVAVENRGLVEASGAQVVLVGRNAVTGAIACQSETKLIGTLAPGRIRNATLSCAVPPTPGVQLRFQARVTLDGEDFSQNNFQHYPGLLTIAAVRRAAFNVDVSPRDESPVAVRSVQIMLTNQGNVPVEDLEVEWELFRLVGTQLEPTGKGAAWTIKESLGLDGKPVRVSAAIDADPAVVDARDLRFRTETPGTFMLVASLSGSGIDEQLARIPLLSQEILYRNDLDTTPAADDYVVEGFFELDEQGVWSKDSSNGPDGSAHLVAGDQVSGEIPTGSDANITLPSIDLSKLRRAALSFEHRFDLEENYDGARVEMSTDGGITWTAVEPRSQPLRNLPLGYSSSPLLGSNPLQGSEVEAVGQAYTGRSTDLPGETSGWLPAEFDLSRQPQFWRTATVDAFPLQGLASHPLEDPDGPLSEQRFTHPSWTLPEEGADDNGRYWWVSNETYNEPKPLSGSRMLASRGAPIVAGIAADWSPRLRVAIPPVNLPPGQRLELSFVDWRAGWRGEGDDGRNGTGGKFLVQQAGAPVNQLYSAITERRPDGWTNRTIDLTAFASTGLVAEFVYVGGVNSSNAFGGRFPSDTQDSRGWFIDRADVIVRAGPFTSPVLALPSSSTLWQTDTVGWTLLTVGKAASDGGWHVAQMDIPGRPGSPVWRFASTDRQGYPNGADSRLVTPLVDLSEYPGDEARLHFEHRYEFDGAQQLAGRAVDAGAVEYQVLDEKTGTFGSWKQMGARLDPDPITYVEGSGAPNYNLGLHAETPLHAFNAMGYPSIAPAAAQSLGDWPGHNLLITCTGGGGHLLPTHPAYGSPLAGTQFARLRLIGTQMTFHLRSGGGNPPPPPNQPSQGDQPVGPCAAPAPPPPPQPCNPQMNPCPPSMSDPAPGVEVLDAIQWVDVDNNGVWSPLDHAYISRAAMNRQPHLNAVQPADVRLTPVPNGGAQLTPFAFGTTVAPGDPDVGRTLQKPGRFTAICREAGFIVVVVGPAHCAAHQYYQPQGYSFPHSPGYIQLDASALPGGFGSETDTTYRRVFQPLQPFPFAYVFSGNSALRFPGSEGWQANDWDITPLIGKKVRFAFHAWTNAWEGPCTWDGGTGMTFQGTTRAKACAGTPLFGWALTNVRVDGQQFKGEPVQLRLRVATDQSQAKGSWAIDNITVVGERYGQRVVFVEATNSHTVLRPSTPLELDGVVRNVGTMAWSDLALAVDVVRSVNGALEPVEPGTVTFAQPESLDEITDGLPPGVTRAYGLFGLAGAGTTGDLIPIKLTLSSPPTAGHEYRVRVFLIQRYDECNSAGICQTAHRVISNERGVGPPAGEWVVVSEIREDLRFVPAAVDSSARMRLDPPLLQTGTPSIVTVSVVNNGTAAPASLTAQWTATEILQKGDPEQHGLTLTLEGRTITTPTRGETSTLETTFEPPRDGLYRIQVTIMDGVRVVDSLVHEVFVGKLEPYYFVDFGKTNADDADWKDASVSPGPDGKGSPPQIRFRQDGSTFIWGVTQVQQIAGQNYCSFDSTCNVNAEGNGPIYGLEGFAEGPAFDLNRVVGDRAVLSLRHSFHFTPFDGGVIEALPVRVDSRGRERAVYTCATPSGQTTPAYFALNPMEDTPYPGQTGGFRAGQYSVTINGKATAFALPVRPNPLGTIPAFTPDGDNIVTRFDLRQAPTAICPVGFALDGAPPTTLLNQTLALRLHTGTAAGNLHNQCNPVQCPGSPRAGSMGWQIAQVAASSTGVSVEPPIRKVPIVDGYAKRYFFEVVNRGVIPDSFKITIDPGLAADPSWFAVPTDQFFLEPGQRARVGIDVNVPTDPRASRGTYETFVVATSLTDPTLEQSGRLDLVLSDQDLPDLDVKLSYESDTAIPEPEKEVRIFTSIQNLGDRLSDAVSVRLNLLDGSTGQILAELEDRSIDELCPAVECGPQHSSVTSMFRWMPTRAGVFRVQVLVDPENRLVQDSRSNDVATIVVDVGVRQRPDVAVQALTIEGLQADGYALEGSLVKFAANITNHGNVAAIGTEARIYAGTSELERVKLSAIPAGAYRTVLAQFLAPAGESIVTVRLLTSADDLRSDNDELKRTLRVRGVALSLAGPDAPIAISPGEEVATSVNVTNLGNAIEHVVIAGSNLPAGWSIATLPNPLTVPPNSSAWAIVTIRAPVDAAAGTRLLTLSASPESRPATTATTTLEAAVAGMLQSPTLEVKTVDAAPGRTRLNVTLQPVANAAQKFRLVIDEPLWSAKPINVTLQPGVPLVVPVMLDIPASTPVGHHLVRMRLMDLGGNASAEALGRVNVTGRPHADAALTERFESRIVDLSARAYELSVVVSNIGNVPIYPDVRVVDLPEGSTAEASTTDEPIQPGASQEILFEVRLGNKHADEVRGAIEVFMRRHDANTTTIELVDRIALPTLAPLPDLRITNVLVQPDGVAKIGRPVAFEVDVSNLGAVASPRTELYAFVNGAATDSFKVRALEAKEHTKVRFEWTFAEPGNYLVYVVADGPGNVTELHKDNNGWVYEALVEGEPEGKGLSNAVPGAPGPEPWLMLVALAFVLAAVRRRRMHA